MKTERRKEMVLNKTCGFRPGDERLVEEFNLALEATGVAQSDLIEQAVRYGLRAATDAILQRQEEERAARDEARKRWFEAKKSTPKQTE